MSTQDHVRTLTACSSLSKLQFEVDFKRVWPYAQGHYGLEEEPKVDSFPELIRSVGNHPLAIQHGEFPL